MLSFLAAHAPLQADPDQLEPCSHMKTWIRRMYCGLVVSIDQTVKQVTDALQRLGLADNTLIIFTTDNGGMPHEGGLSHPYRGTKNSLFEGGLRGPAFVTAPPGWFQKSGYRYQGLFHISDWFPTVLHLVDQEPHRNPRVEPNPRPRLIGLPHIRPELNYSLDGFNMWQILSTNGVSPRTEVVGQIDIFTGEACYRYGKWKIVLGFPHDPDWYDEPVSWVVTGSPSPIDYVTEVLEGLFIAAFGTDAGYFWQEILNEVRIYYNDKFKYHLGPPEAQSVTVNGTWLFDLEADPQERHNVYAKYPEMGAEMEARLNHIRNNLPTQCDWARAATWKFLAEDPAYPDKKFAGPWAEEDLDLSALKLTDLRIWFVDTLTAMMKRVLMAIAGGFVLLVLLAYLLYRFCCRKSKVHSKTH